MHVPKILHRYSRNTLWTTELRFARQQIFESQIVRAGRTVYPCVDSLREERNQPFRDCLSGLAQTGHSNRFQRCPLSGVPQLASISVSDPQQTWGGRHGADAWLSPCWQGTSHLLHAVA
jgi:hypothetical protein